MNRKITAILAATILFSANFASAEEGAAAAPAEINHENSIYFTEPDFYNMTSNDNLIILPKYPTYQQTTEYTCGPAAALTVLQYYKNNDYDEMKIAKEMKTKSYPVGTNPINMVNFFKGIGWKVQSSLNSKPFTEYADFQNFVTKNLRLGRPILVDNIEWGGHWRVIIGYDSMNTNSDLDDVLIFADSYDTSDHKQDGYTVGNGWRFFSMWFAHSNTPKIQRNQPYVVAYPN